MEISKGGQSEEKKKKKGKEKLEELKKDISTDIHKISLEECLRRLETDAECGLSAEKAALLLLQNGPNRLTPPKKTPEIVKFIQHWLNGFNLLLMIGGILSMGSFIVTLWQYDFNWSLISKENFYLALVLVGVSILNATFSYIQEFHSAKIMESFTKLIPQQCIVIREGKRTETDVTDLVVGDLVEVKGGDKLPADIRIISSSSFKVDNSSLTGESEAQSRLPECTNDNPLETKNLAFFSTSVVEGTCKGVVVAVGDRTVMGRIAGLTSGLKEKKSPLRREIEFFIKEITVFATVKGAILVIISLLLGYTWLDGVIFFIAIIIANVPEGLTTLITLGMFNLFQLLQAYEITVRPSTIK